jgi:hypothetical protein
LGPALAQLEHGLDTIVGPGGVKLSGGQIQRTAAACFNDYPCGGPTPQTSLSVALRLRPALKGLDSKAIERWLIKALELTYRLPQAILPGRRQPNRSLIEKVIRFRAQDHILLLQPVLYLDLNQM